MQTVTKFNTSTNRGLGHTRQTAVRSLQEIYSSRAVLRIALQLVLDMRRGSILNVPPKQLYRSTTVLAAKLGIAVDQGVGNQLHLPEGLVSTAGTYSATLHFSLIKLLALDCHCSPQILVVLRWIDLSDVLHANRSALTQNSGLKPQVKEQAAVGTVERQRLSLCPSKQPDAPMA